MRIISKDILLVKLGIVLGLTVATLCYLNTAASVTDSFVNSVPAPNVRQNGLRADSAGRVTTVIPDCPPTGTVVARETKELDFLMLGKKLGTDKVDGNFQLPDCLKNPEACTRKGCVREQCRPWGHFYNTMYQQRLAKFSDQVFQFLEIGFFNGHGYDTYSEFLPKAEVHSLEISCLPNGTREEGLWPWGNFAEVNENYQTYRDSDRLHCGDASDLKFLNDTWATSMKRPDAPPLKVVVDDGSHLSSQMAQSFFFWFQRIEPGGLMIVEDIQPIEESNKFRTQFLPQIMNDLHYCGDPSQPDDAPCFPEMYKFLQGIHCEMHICIFERNDHPAIEPSMEASSVPAGALDLKTCKSLSKSFGIVS